MAGENKRPLRIREDMKNQVPRVLLSSIQLPNYFRTQGHSVSPEGQKNHIQAFTPLAQKWNTVFRLCPTGEEPLGPVLLEHLWPYNTTQWKGSPRSLCLYEPWFHDPGHGAEMRAGRARLKRNCLKSEGTTQDPKMRYPS